MLIEKENKKYFLSKQKKIKTNELTVFGFWIYLMSDLIIFACIFITYTIFIPDELQIKKNIFNVNIAFFETIFLLSSSFIYSLINTQTKKKISFILTYIISSFLLGLIFIILEIYELIDLIEKNYQPNKNAFLSAFFTLISIHGIHVIFGLIWMLFMIIQIKINKFNEIIKTRLKCLGLYWHFLDIIWIFIFSFVYLFGVI